jgi:hypothetical protein
MQFKLFEAASKCGKLTWEQGILYKGNGICHGITGNGYMLHCLYRAFKRLSQDLSDPKAVE